MTNCHFYTHLRTKTIQVGPSLTPDFIATVISYRWSEKVTL